MNLSDAVGGAGLSFYAEIALLIFCVVFLVLGVRLLFFARADMERAARLPFDDEASSQFSAPSRAE